MKPVTRPEYLDVWILANMDSMLNISTFFDANTRQNVFYNEKAAQQQQLLEALKGNQYYVFHLEIPAKA